MGRIALFGAGVVVCGLAFASFNASAQIINGGGNQPSKCLVGAKVALTANPTAVAYGQSSTLQWSVDFPSGCSTVRVQFNGATVSDHGSQSVTPPSTSTYTLILSDTHLGVFGERNTTAQVAVTYPA
jgi:hypothetical protein